jgi:aminoglycoside phosphotransferase
VTGSPLDLFAAAASVRIRSSAPVAVGRSGAVKYRIEVESGKQFFVKVATRSASSRSRELVRREADILAQFPADLDTPTLRNYVDTDAITAFSTDWIRGVGAARWEPGSAVRAVNSLIELYEILREMKFEARILEQEQGRFRTFANSLELPRSEALGPDRVDWVERQRGTLVQLERFGREQMDARDLMHCDLAADNVLMRTRDRPMFVDWGHARLGNQAFDLASLLIRVRAENAWSPAMDRLVATSALVGSQMSWAAMLALATGMFLETSRGEADRPSETLSEQRATYSRAGIDLLKEVLD